MRHEFHVTNAATNSRIAALPESSITFLRTCFNIYFSDVDPNENRFTMLYDLCRIDYTLHITLQQTPSKFQNVFLFSSLIYNEHLYIIVNILMLTHYL